MIAVQCAREGCSNEFTRSSFDHVGRRFCSARCRVAHLGAVYREQRKALPKPEPLEPGGDGSLPPEHNVDGPHTTYKWNGRAQYSEVAPLKFPYVRKCSMCGRHPPVEWLTEARARLLSLAGLSPCVICNGWVFMDLQEVGGMGSPQKAAPARTVAEPVRPVARRVA